MHSSFAQAWPRYVLFVIVLTPVAALGLAMDSPWTAAFAAGTVFGIVLTNDSDFRRFRQFWPASKPSSTGTKSINCWKNAPIG